MDRAGIICSTPPMSWFPDCQLLGTQDGKRTEDEIPNGPIKLYRVSSNELADVVAIFDDLLAYSRRVGGPADRAGAASQFAIALPTGCRPDNKHAFIAYQNGTPAGLLDIINGYPRRGTAFIGLLAVRESMQGLGIGRTLAALAERFVRSDLKAGTIRLAVVEANPVSAFWQKMGFAPTGEVKPYEAEAVRSRSILMEKAL